MKKMELSDDVKKAISNTTGRSFDEIINSDMEMINFNKKNVEPRDLRFIYPEETSKKLKKVKKLKEFPKPK